MRADTGSFEKVRTREIRHSAILLVSSGTFPEKIVNSGNLEEFPEKLTDSRPKTLNFRSSGISGRIGISDPFIALSIIIRKKVKTIF